MENNSETQNNSLLEQIAKYGLEPKVLDGIKETAITDHNIRVRILIAEIENLIQHNDLLRDSLEKIASGLLSLNESREQAQSALELTAAVRRLKVLKPAEQSKC